MIDALADQGGKFVRFQIYSAEEPAADLDPQLTWAARGMKVVQVLHYGKPPAELLTSFMQRDTRAE
jgi:hypothetical protein